MTRLDRVIGLSIVLPPMARSSRAITKLTTESQRFGRMVLILFSVCSVALL
jgi:hypothetical protein